MALYQNGILISGRHDLPAMTWAQYQALSVDERPQEWVCTDRDYTAIPRESVSITADGVKTNAQLLNALNALVDYTKVTAESFVVRKATGGSQIVYSNQFFDSGYGYYSFTMVSGTAISVGTVYMASNSTYKAVNGNTYSDESATIPSSGTKYTLYY